LLGDHHFPHERPRVSFRGLSVQRHHAGSISGR
jgi:hypothetical protein